MQNSTPEDKDPDNISFAREIENLGFNKTDIKKMRYWTGRSNINVVSTLFTKQISKSCNCQIKTEERLGEIGKILTFELAGNVNSPFHANNYSIVSKNQSFWKRQSNSEIEKHYDITGKLNDEQIEIASSLLELKDIYLEIHCKASQMEFKIIIEENPSKHLESVLNIITKLINFNK